MARKPRIHVPGGVYHIMLRGNGGQKIFYANKDYTRFLKQRRSADYGALREVKD